jgi:hypothetical protein
MLAIIQGTFFIFLISTEKPKHWKKYQHDFKRRNFVTIKIALIYDTKYVKQNTRCIKYTRTSILKKVKLIL